MRRRNGPTSCASCSSGSTPSSRSSPARRRSAPHRRSLQQGELELQLVMLAGALGAIVGDSSLFWIARKSAARVQGQLDKALENPKIRAGWDALDRSPGLLDRRRALRPRDALRRQRNHGALEHSLPPLPPLVGPGRSPVVGLHVRAWPTTLRPRSPAFRSRRSSSPRSSRRLRWQLSTSLTGGGGERSGAEPTDGTAEPVRPSSAGSDE